MGADEPQLAQRVTARPDFRRPWAYAGLLTDVAAGRPPHALARHVGTRPPHVACAHVGVSQPTGEKRPSARTPAGPGPRRSVAARPIAQARTRSRLICERGACAYQLRKPGLWAGDAVGCGDERPRRLPLGLGRDSCESALSLARWATTWTPARGCWTSSRAPRTWTAPGCAACSSTARRCPACSSTR